MSNATIHEVSVNVTEFTSFEAAWEAATATKASFDYYQGMETKIGYIRKAARWFVDMDKMELYYSYETNDGIRIIKEASPISILSNSPFQYVQLMVNPNPDSNPTRQGKLRFSGQYFTREGAIKISKDSPVFAFNK